MLDVNLPTFYIKSPNDDHVHQSTILLTQGGREPEPTYLLRSPDPALSSSKNCYSIALFDTFNSEVLFAEVLVRPEWQQQTLTAAELRRGETIPPPPLPVIPTDFIVQLYAPDQQVHVRQKPGSWGGSSFWEFELPQRSFRQPSTSSLDRSRHDPAASQTTPKLNFKWKKDGKLSKDLVCLLSGKSTDAEDGRRSGNREPDITIALFKNLRNITLYEPNLQRVEMEDLKGLEITLLLSAAVIRDMFYGNLREVFNLSSPTRRASGDRISPPILSATGGVALLPQKRLGPSVGSPPVMPPRTAANGAAGTFSRPPPADPMTQWQIDAEAKRLQAEAEGERKARDKAEQKERRRIRRMLEVEEAEARRREQEIDRETERLKRIFAMEQKEVRRRGNIPPIPASQLQRPQYANSPNSWLTPAMSSQQGSYPRPRSTPPPARLHNSGTRAQHHRPAQSTQSLQLSKPAPTAPMGCPIIGAVLGPGSSGLLRPDGGRGDAMPFSSLFSLKAHQDAGKRLNKKKSSMF